MSPHHEAGHPKLAKGGCPVFALRVSAAGTPPPSLQGWIHGVPQGECRATSSPNGGTNSTTFIGEVPGSGFLTTVEPTP